MDTSSSVESANDSGNKSEDSASCENNDTSCRDGDLMPFEMNDEEEEEDGEDLEEDEEDSDNNDNERYGEDLLLALGEGYSEERNDLPEASNHINVPPSKFHMPFLKKSQDSSTGLTGGLDILNLNAQLSKLVVPGTSGSTNTNTCLFLNNIYQTLLMENLTKVQQKLAENQEKQKVLLEKIKETHKVDPNKPRKNVFCIPYFHRKGNTPKPNDHTKILQTWHYDKIVREKPWTYRDHALLLEAVHENAWEMTLRPFLQRLELYSVKMATFEDVDEWKEYAQKIEEWKEYAQKIEDTKLEMEIAQQRDINEIINEIGDEKFDWMKISNLALDGKHSEFSCRLMWKNWLHPRLNKSPWIPAETKKLKELVTLHGRHQWKLIAEELGTNRTPFHCLQHYRRKLEHQVKRGWTEEEDKILKEVIETCRIGDNIPWNQVSFYMEGRSADSCGKRWHFLNPAIKRGRWTTVEDSLLLAGVNMFGTTNWNRIKQVVLGRTSTQCRERWINCLDPRIKAEAFTYDEDKLLLKFIKEHGCNWSLVSKMLPGRTDSACRKQYERLKKWETGTKYVLKQSDESKTFFINDFDVKPFADLVEANKTLDELFPLLPPQNQIEIIWKNQQQMLKRDLIRQELDRRKGEIFVPRPQLLRKYTNNTLVRLWEHRKQMRQNIEDFIQKQMVKNKNKSPKKGIEGYTMGSPILNNLKPNTSVTEMLKIARIISPQPEEEKSVSNKKHLSADIDKRIRNLLYIHWLKEDMKDKPKLAINKSKASCEAEKYLDRLEGMTLIMTVLGMDRENIKEKVLHGSSSGPLQSTSYMTADELQNFREAFLLISQDPQCSVNFSGKRTPKVEYSDIIPPNIHTLTAFRILILQRQKLQKSADYYPTFRKKNNTNSDESYKKFLTLPEKMEKVKKSFWYNMLRVHFRSLFMWPALLCTTEIGARRRLGASKPHAKKKCKKSRYPLSKQPTRRKRKIDHHTDGPCHSSNEKKEQIPEPSEESKNSEIPTATVAPPPVAQIPRKRGVGRPLGSVTKHRKMFDPVPQRISSRQREKKAQLDSELSAGQQAETTNKQTLVQQTPSSSTNSQGPETTEVDPAASAKTKDLLANVSPNLVQQVISQEVQVKPVGTYITIPISAKSSDMPLWD